MMDRLGAITASEALPWTVATLFTATTKGGLVGMASGIEEVRECGKGLRDIRFGEGSWIVRDKPQDPTDSLILVMGWIDPQGQGAEAKLVARASQATTRHSVGPLGAKESKPSTTWWCTYPRVPSLLATSLEWDSGFHLTPARLGHSWRP
jgi:hypothetical protein